MARTPTVPLAFLIALVVVSLFQSPIRAHALPSFGIDSSTIQGCSHSTNSCSALLSTSNANDIIIVYTYEALDLQTSCTFSVNDTAHLSWQLRASVSGRNDGSTGANRDQAAEFWARSTGILVSDNITEAIAGCAGVYGGEYNGLIALGISGANLNTPFDPNPAAPATANGYSNTPMATISTNTVTDLIVAAGLQSSYPIGAGTGFTALQGNWLNSVVEYKQTTSKVSNLPVTFSDNTTWYWEIIADAIQPAVVITPPLVLSTGLSVGSTYFPGDKAVITVRVTAAQVPVSSSALRLAVTIVAPDKSLIEPTVSSIGTGLFIASYELPETALTGTYTVGALAQLANATSGSSTTSFQVQLPATDSQTNIVLVGLGLGVVGMLGLVLGLWGMGYFGKYSRKRIKQSSLSPC